MGSFEAPERAETSAFSWGYLLQELQMIWDEVGEDQLEREKVLMELEQECQEVYRRKVDRANILRAKLHQELADSEAELTHLLLSLGERSLPGRPEKMSGTLKEQLESITPALREMQLRKKEREKQFHTVMAQIQKISAEIAGRSEYNTSSNSKAQVDDNDLSLKKLEEFQNELQRLEKEKGDRLERVEKYIDKIKNLSATLGMDSSMIITKVHPSLNELSGLSKNISDDILTKLATTVESLQAEKHTRIEKLRQLGKSLINMWDLMDTPYGDRHPFFHVTKLLSVSSEQITSPGSLTQDITQKAETEVKRLDQQKASKMKELFLKKQMELEEICNRSHMEVPSRGEVENILNQIDSGEIDHAVFLKSMDDQILRAAEEAYSRKVIMEKVEKWMLARDEERWLEEYSLDENRYSVQRGAHKNLRRAERARAMVNKIPGLVEMLISYTKRWEEERNKVFLYDEVPLLGMLEEYNVSRKEKEEEKQRQREMKKVQNQMEYMSSSRPGSALMSSRPGTSTGRRTSDMSLNCGSSSSPMHPRLSSMGSPYKMPPSPSFTKDTNKPHAAFKLFSRNGLASHPREDAVSVVSTYSGPLSP